jgi:hypothetical protein
MRMDGDPVAARVDADGSRQSWQGTPDGLDPSLQAGTALWPETEREASVEPIDERDITELITANREGNTAVSLAAAPGLSLTSVKRLLRCPPDVIYPRSYEGSADRDASIALQSRRHRPHSGMCGRRPYAARAGCGSWPSSTAVRERTRTPEKRGCPGHRPRHPPVEVPGIEPGSSVASSGLLRAQSTKPLLGSTGHADQPV